MLVPAVLYKDEIKRRMLEYKYTNDIESLSVKSDKYTKKEVILDDSNKS